MTSESKKQQSSPKKTHMMLSIVGALLFYIALYAVSKWFPIMTGHTMQSDWAVILVASVPLVIVIAYMVMDLFPKISAEVGGVKVSLEKAMEHSTKEMIQFDYQLADSFLEKGDLEDLNYHLEKLRDNKKSPSILLVPLSGNTGVTFPGLKQYIHELAKISSMRYIVFVDMNRTYLGFMSISTFIAKYPKTSLEIILDDMISDEKSAEYWSNTFQLRNYVNPAQLKRDFMKLAIKQWIGEIDDLDDRQKAELERAVFLKQLDGRKSNLDKSRLRESEFLRQDYRKGRQPMDLASDIQKLGAITAHVSKDEKPIAAYDRMREYAVNGLPIVDENNKFVGMIVKEELLDQLLRHFLTIAEQKHES